MQPLSTEIKPFFEDCYVKVSKKKTESYNIILIIFMKFNVQVLQKNSEYQAKLKKQVKEIICRV